MMEAIMETGSPPPKPTGRKRGKNGGGGGGSGSGGSGLLPASLLFHRQRQGRLSSEGQAALLDHAERRGVTRARGAYVSLPPSTKSTIAVATSPCGRFVASTHGDHTVKVTEFHTGRLVHTLVGHARTPWTVKFHPQDATLLCSGCIGGEVRLWSLPTGRCLRAATLDLPVISLAFHSGGNGSGGSSSAASGGEPQHLLAIATFHSLYLWPYARLDQPYHEWQSARLLRCVLFPPGGHSILLGLGNDSGPPRPPPPPPPPPSQQGGQQQGGGGVGGNAPSYQLPPPRPGPKAFHLFLWAFDADKALVPRAARPPPAPARPTAAYGRDRNPAPPAYASPLSRPRPVLERALLYNDGGVDLGVGPGGEAFLVACAELAPSDVPPPAEGEEQVQPPPPQQQQQQHWPLRPYLVTVALPSVVEEEEGEGEGTKDEAKEEEEEEEAPAWATEASEQQQQHQQQQQQESPRRLLPPVLAARPLDGVPPGGVTSVKLSGSGRLVLLGYGVRDSYGAAAPHPVLDVFDASKGLVPVTTVRTRVDEDVNIARFHPFSAQGFLYGTKQGRLRVFMPGGSGECRVRRGPGLVDAHDDDEEEEEEENENV